MPHTLRALQLDDETIAELTVMSRFDDDLAGRITATSNRIRGLLLSNATRPSRPT